MAKPSTVYHGSHRHIEGALEPRSHFLRPDDDPEAGAQPCLFASDDAQYAGVQAAVSGRDLAVITRNGQHFAIFRDQPEGFDPDMPLQLYALPADTFKVVPDDLGEPSALWTSHEAVLPESKTEITPRQLMELGVQFLAAHPDIDDYVWYKSGRKGDDETFINRVITRQLNGELPLTMNELDMAQDLVDAGLLRHVNAELGIQPATLPPSPNSAIIGTEISWLQQRVAQQESARADGKSWAASLDNTNDREQGL